MKTEKFLDKFKNGFYLVTYAFVLVLILMHFSDILGWFGKLVSSLSPLIYGVAIAFILNVPMSIIENYLVKKSDGTKKWHRAVSIVLTLVFALVVIVVLSSVIFPQVIENMSMLVNNITIYLNNLINLLNDLLKSLHLEDIIQIDNIFSMPLNDVITQIADWFSTTVFDVVGNTLTVTMNIASAIVTTFMAFMVSLYLLSSKEKLITQCRKLTVALCSKEVYERIFYIMSKVNYTFTKFISGQLLEACILGSIFYIVLLILRMPYALLISCCIAVTSIVPIFGAMIGMCFGFILILAIQPIQALIFIAVFQLIQQLEGNLIYPKVVGNSVGLPGLWVLLSILVFGSMYGLVGMLLAVPSTAVVYTLFREYIYSKLQKKQLVVTLDSISKIESKKTSNN